MSHNSGPNRRELFELLGAGVVFQAVSSGAAPSVLGSRLHIAPDGSVTLLTGKVELGQGSRTLLAQCVAEEMGIELSRVRVLMADTAQVPDDGGTFASLTTPLAVPVIRQAAAAARQMLRTLKPDAAMLREIPVEVKLTPPAEWKVLGTPAPKLNARDVVTGRQKYSTDLRVPEMLAGKVLRPEAYEASLVSLDASGAERVPGVRVVRDANFAGVVAPDEETAARAVALLRAEWRAKQLIGPPELFEHFKKTAEPAVANPNSRYPPLLEQGSVARGLEQAAIRHAAAYALPNIAHVPMEPRAAVAWWDEHGLTVYCGTHVPFGVRKQLAAAFTIPETSVRLIVADSGGGFGGKHGPEVMLEAARLAKAAGMPVRVAWSREEEFTRSYCRPAGMIEVRSGLAADGRIVAWEFHNYNSGPASLAVPYAIPNYWCGFHRADSPLRMGPYRSLAAVGNTFARESHVDELATLAGEDPLEFRMRNLENPRLREVVSRAAERFGWSKWAKSKEGPVGMACNIEKGGHMALFVEMNLEKAGPRVRRAVIAFECGAVLNPDNLRNQIAGAVNMGIGGALFEELRYDGSKLLNPRLSQYRVPRFADAPPIDVILVDRRDLTPAGAGESPITVAAPAIAAALFRIAGTRSRTLPLSLGAA